jgi:predicted nucleic acid-binding protein
LKVVIVDTTVWIDYLRGEQNAESDWLDKALGLQTLGITDLILCEVLLGIPGETEFQRVLQDLRKCILYDTGGEEVALAAANNFRRLRRAGYTIRRTIDCWIASFCILRGHSLLHRDRDFAPFETMLGLSVVHP